MFRVSRKHKNFGRWAFSKCSKCKIFGRWVFGNPESTKSLDDGPSGIPKVQKLWAMGFRESRKCKIFGRRTFGFPESTKSLDDGPSGFPKVDLLRTMWHCKSPTTPFLSMKLLCNLLLVRHLNSNRHPALTNHLKSNPSAFCKMVEERQLKCFLYVVFPINYFLDKYRIMKRYTYLC